MIKWLLKKIREGHQRKRAEKRIGSDVANVVGSTADKTENARIKEIFKQNFDVAYENTKKDIQTSVGEHRKAYAKLRTHTEELEFWEKRSPLRYCIIRNLDLALDDSAKIRTNRDSPHKQAEHFGSCAGRLMAIFYFGIGDDEVNESDIQSSSGMVEKSVDNIIGGLVWHNLREGQGSDKPIAKLIAEIATKQNRGYKKDFLMNISRIFERSKL